MWLVRAGWPVGGSEKGNEDVQLVRGAAHGAGRRRVGCRGRDFRANWMLRIEMSVVDWQNIVVRREGVCCGMRVWKSARYI